MKKRTIWTVSSGPSRHPAFWMVISMVAAVGFVAFGLSSIWIIAGVVENIGLWWLYALASVGSVTVAFVLLGVCSWAQDRANNNVIHVRKTHRR